jgi:TctA family transporter
MELISNLALGFGVAFTLTNLLYCFFGVLLGTLIGVLPGIGPVPTIAMLLPITYALPPVSALIMLAGIYYGAQYGGSTTAILVNLPGESSSVVTCIDGYQMARRGKAGKALSVAGDRVVHRRHVRDHRRRGVRPAARRIRAEVRSRRILLADGARPARRRRARERLAAEGHRDDRAGPAARHHRNRRQLGLQRYTFGVPELSDGIGFVVVAMGLFGFAEIIVNLEHREHREVFTDNVTGLWLKWAEFKEALPAILRGTSIGSVLGILPGGGAMLSAFAAYTIEKKIAKDPSQFGKGAIQGVAGPESANNAGAQTSFIPLLTLGIPPNAVMALMVGAMTIHSIQPGPQVMTSNPQLFWGLIASMWIGNVMLVVLNLPMIGIWVKLLKVPYRLLYPAILLFCCIGVYSLQNNVFDVLITALFGVLGWVFVKLECEPAPLLLGFILGPLMEENLRRALLLSRGDPTVFFTRPLSLGMLVAAGLLLLIIVLPAVRKTREVAFHEETV